MDVSGLQWAIGLGLTALLAALGGLATTLGKKLSVTDFDRELANINAAAEREATRRDAEIKELSARADRLRDALDDRARNADLASLRDSFGQLQRQVSGLEARMAEVTEMIRGVNNDMDEMKPDVKQVLRQLNRLTAHMPGGNP